MRKVLYSILAISLIGAVLLGVLAFIFWKNEDQKLFILIVLVVIFVLFIVLPIAIQKIQKLNAMENRLPTVKGRQIKKGFLSVFAAIL